MPKLLAKEADWAKKLHPRGSEGKKPFHQYSVKRTQKAARKRIQLQFHCRIAFGKFWEGLMVRHMFKCWAHRIVFLVTGRDAADWEQKVIGLKHEVFRSPDWAADVDKMDLEALYPKKKQAQKKKAEIKEYFDWAGQSSSA